MYLDIIDEKNVSTNLNKSIKEIIDLDCKRTHFSEDKELKQKVFYN